MNDAIETAVPATVAQAEVWLASEREPESDRYNVPLALELSGRVDVAALRMAVGDVVAAHAALRSRFETVDGELRQLIAEDLPVPFAVFRGTGGYRREAALTWAASVTALPFELCAGPPLRAALLVHEDAALLALTLHHVISDGWSLDVLAADLVAAYASRVAGVAWSRPGDRRGAVRPVAGDADADVRYWERLLDGEWSQLAPFRDCVGGPLPGASVHVESELPPALFDALSECAEQERVSTAVFVLAAWTLLLHAWSGDDDGVVGMPFAGRAPDDADEIELFTRVLPIRTRFEPRRPFRSWLAELRGQVLDSLEHSRVPLERLRELTSPAGTRPTAYLSVYSHMPEPGREWHVGDTVVRVVQHDSIKTMYDISLAAIERRGSLRLRNDYDAQLYRRETVEVLHAQIGTLLELVVRRPDAQCRDLLSSLAEPRATPVAPAPRTLVPEAVRRSAAERPNAVAVRHGDVTLTYGELVARAEALAAWLQQRDVGPERVVALLLPPGTETIVAILGVVLAGGAYLPLDAAYPDAQLRTILRDAAPQLVFAARENAGRLRVAGVDVYVLDDAFAAAAELAQRPAPVEIDPDLALNVLYTSGSTGKPKGVVLPHGGLVRLLGDPSFIMFDEADVIAQLSPLNFDGASYEIWGALTAGAELVVLDKEVVLSPPELRRVVQERGITTLIVTTPLVNRIVDDAPGLLQSLRRVYFGGELVSVPHVCRALRWAPGGTLLHSYGPTENSFTSTWRPIHELDEEDRTIPVGHEVPGTTAYVVFEDSFELTPRCAPGELLLGGAGVARGYLGDPSLTAAKFVPNPFVGGGARLYRTGDRVRWTATGELEFIGRRDTQVKIRSQRVELGEVSAVLIAQPSVASAVVDSRVNGRGEKEIVAYVVLDDANALPVVKAALRASLPPFAVPTHILVLDELPLTPNGKVDRRRLPAPEETGSTPAPVPIAAPAASDASVRGAWAEVLGSAAFGDDDNFFDVGGHSLLLVKLQEALRTRVGRAPTISELLRYTTVRSQTTFLVPTEGKTQRAATSARSTATSGAIAVIGIGCRFAGSPDAVSYWENLRAGLDCIATGPGEVVVELDDGARRVARWGMLADGPVFDPELFGFDERDLDELDPQKGVFYECLWAAVEDAALRMSAIAQRTSLYAGCARMTLPPRDARVDDVVNADATFLSTRFSYWHDLWGESVLLDTACSTSLVATQLACQSLLSGSSDYALAGGVCIDPSSDGSYTFRPGLLYARDGVCRPMDVRASGTVGGFGAGAVLLRRLEDAARDGDPIYAVIRGGAVTNDGRARVAYTAPGVEGQIRVIERALAGAGVDGSEIDFVEAHGTGTRLGDTIEASALGEALGVGGPPVAVGSAKASIGHTDTAAGIAGLIKATLAVHHGWLPATPNVREAIPELGTRLELVPEGRPWPDHGRPRRAGVSSFGVGGTNAHVVLEQVPTALAR